MPTHPGFWIPPNVMLENKLEQETLLAHPNTVLFIMHCGINSIAEAVFHRVPMIGMPLGFDQVRDPTLHRSYD